MASSRRAGGVGPFGPGASRQPVPVHCTRSASSSAGSTRSTSSTSQPATAASRSGLTPVRTGQASSTRRREVGQPVPGPRGPLRRLGEVDADAAHRLDHVRGRRDQRRLDARGRGAARGSRPTSPRSPAPARPAPAGRAAAPAWPSPGHPTGPPPRRPPCPGSGRRSAGCAPGTGAAAARSPGGHSLTSRPVSAMRCEQRAVRRRVGPVDAAGQHRQRRRLGGHRAAVGGGVDAEGATGDHGPAPLPQLVAELRRRRARRTRSTPATRRSRPTARRARRGGPGRGPTARPAEPARVVRSDWCLWSSGSLLTATVRACSGRAGHSSSSGTTSRAPHRSARRRSARVSSCCGPGTHQRPDPLRCPPGPQLPDRLHRADRVDEPPEVDRPRLGRPAEPRPGPPEAGMHLPRGQPPAGQRRGVLQVLVERHAATRCRRMPRASATSSGPGTVRPARSASVQATRSTRSKPRTDSAPRSSARSASAQRRRGAPPSARAAAGRAPGCSPSGRSRPAARPRRHGLPPPGRPPPPSTPAPRARPARPRGSPAAGPPAGRCGRAAARTAATGSAAARADCRCTPCRPRRWRTGTGLAARTSCARHGKVAEPAARWMVTLPRSSGWRRVSRTARGNSGASSRNSTPRWARHRAPGRICPEPPPISAAIVAEWCGASKGGRAISGASGGSVPGDRVDRGHLERRPARRAAGGGRAAARPASSCRPRAGRSGTGGGRRRRRPRPPAVPRPARRRRRGRARRAARAAGRGRAGTAAARPARWSTTSREGARGQHLDALDQRGLLGVGRGHDHLRVARPGPRPAPPGGRRGCPGPSRRGPARRGAPAGSTDSGGTAPPAARIAGGQREVEAAPLLGHRRRGQPDGDAALREARRRR